MDTPFAPLTPEIENLLAQHGGPFTVPGQQSDYVLMRSDVYQAMLGMADGEEAETLAAVRRGVADLQAGRTYDLDEVFDDLDHVHES